MIYSIFVPGKEVGRYMRKGGGSLSLSLSLGSLSTDWKGGLVRVPPFAGGGVRGAHGKFRE